MVAPQQFGTLRERRLSRDRTTYQGTNEHPEQAPLRFRKIIDLWRALVLQEPPVCTEPHLVVDMKHPPTRPPQCVLVRTPRPLDDAGVLPEVRPALIPAVDVLQLETGFLQIPG